MLAKFGRGPTVVSEKGGVEIDKQTQKGTLQLYIVEDSTVEPHYYDHPRDCAKVTLMER